MNKVEIIKGIDTTIEGLEAIKRALGAEESAPVEAPAKATKTVGAKKAQKEAMNPPAEETEGSAPVMTGEFNVDELNSMKYNEFKKLAATLGVKCTGTRDEIMQRILALDPTATVVSGDAEDEAPAKEEKAPAKSDKPTASKKLGKAKTAEPARDEFDEQAEEVAKETAVEDIIEALADVKIKATKKDAVVKLAEALRKGLIELDAEEEGEEPAEDTAEEAGDEEEIGADSYFPEYDPDGYNDPEKMSDERKEAVEAKMDEILTEISEGNLEEDDITSYIEDHATEEEIDLLADDCDSDEYIKLYMELVKRTIDNDGEEHEPADVYELGDENMCCGHVLKYSKKNNKYICEHCGTEYEAE